MHEEIWTHEVRHTYEHNYAYRVKCTQTSAKLFQVFRREQSEINDSFTSNERIENKTLLGRSSLADLRAKVRYTRSWNSWLAILGCRLYDSVSR